MGSIFGDVAAVIAAILEGDSWGMKEAFGGPGIWLVGLIAVVLGAWLIAKLYRLSPFIEKHLERALMVWSYLLIAGIIFVEVVRRFVFNEQVPWSTTLPPYLFLIMTWFGCAYNVRLRTHLAFSEFRTNLPRVGQMLCLSLDAFLWMGICWVVVVTSMRVVVNSAANFQIMLGTDNVMQWWFLLSVPISFVMLAARAYQNLSEDIANFRSGEDLISTAVIGGE
ncbi:MAG: TRAP transporter small permease [Alphaproteobacteria bacterium]